VNGWEGTERRKGGTKDHDLLIRIDANVTTFMDQFDKHEADNKLDFKTLFSRTGTTQKFMWLIAGALAIMEFYFRVISK